MQHIFFTKIPNKRVLQRTASNDFTKGKFATIRRIEYQEFEYQ